MTISVNEYIRRVDENTKEFINQMKENSFDITKFHGFDVEKGILSPIILLKKVHDIFAAVVLRKLPYLKKNHGADAVELSNTNEFIDIELKTSYNSISESKAFKTAANTVYFTKDVKLWKGDWVDRNKTALAKSQFNAKFEIKNNLHTKERKTYLLCIDSDSSEFICAYSMPGKKVLEFLETSKDIKLASFMTYGTEVTDLVLEPVGWDKWIERHLPILETKRCSTKTEENKRLTKEEIKKQKVIQKKLNSQNTSLLNLDSLGESKIDPIQQSSTPCIELNDQPQIQDQPEILPIGPFD